MRALSHTCLIGSHELLVLPHGLSHWTWQSVIAPATYRTKYHCERSMHVFRFESHLRIHPLWCGRPKHIPSNKWVANCERLLIQAMKATEPQLSSTQSIITVQDYYLTCTQVHEATYWLTGHIIICQLFSRKQWLQVQEKKRLGTGKLVTWIIHAHIVHMGDTILLIISLNSTLSQKYGSNGLRASCNIWQQSADILTIETVATG